MHTYELFCLTNGSIKLDRKLLTIYCGAAKMELADKTKKCQLTMFDVFDQSTESSRCVKKNCHVAADYPEPSEDCKIACMVLIS